jgi:NAD dependent epimerase/dehydratase family enzyme
LTIPLPKRSIRLKTFVCASAIGIYGNDCPEALMKMHLPKAIFSHKCAT